MLGLSACSPSEDDTKRIQASLKSTEESRFTTLGLETGMKRTLVEKKISKLLGRESGYTADPMGTAGGKVTYIDGLWKLEVRYLRGRPGETGVDEKGNFEDYTPAIDEEIIDFKINKLSPTVSTILAPEFGSIMNIKGRFVEKTVKWVKQRQQFVEPCTAGARAKKLAFLEVLSVNGKDLSEPVKMEYAIDNTSRLRLTPPPKFSPEKDKIYELVAYETIVTEGKPWGWNQHPDYYGYQVVNKLVIRQKE